MGLDICNDSCESVLSDLLYFHEFKNQLDIEEEVEALIDQGKYDKIVKLLSDINIYNTAGVKDIDGLKDSIDSYIQDKVERVRIFNSFTEKQVDTSQYKYLYEDDDVCDSRMGSYSVIHSLRSVADNLRVSLGVESLEEFANAKLTKEEVLEAIYSSLTNHTNYEEVFFNNLCGHSDCDGYYLPTEERLDFDHGSSIGLFYELDAIYKSGAVDLFKEIEAEYKNSEKQIDIHYMAINCEWVWRKLMYHAIGSIDYKEMIVFC